MSMNDDLVIIDVEEPAPAPRALLIACPVCGAGIAFARSPVPHMDECGFESYRFECKDCGAVLAGIVDPADEALLLTETAI
jgi:hypothetical protein